MNLLDLDIRWRRFNDPDWRSPIDGRAFGGVYDLGFDHPDDWAFGDRGDTGPDVLEVGENRLSAELCRLGARRFLRGVLPLPLRGAEDEALWFAPWVEVSQDDFYAALDALSPDPGTTPDFAGCEGQLANALPGFGRAPRACRLMPGAEGERFRILPEGGPLAEVQENGLGFDDLLDLYAEAGDDIRPHLE